MPTPRQTYDQFVSEIATDHMPRFGFNSVGDLPPLAHTDVAVCIDANPDVTDFELPAMLARFYRERNGDLIAAMHTLVKAIDAAVLPEVRRQLLEDVICHVEAEEELA